jgi:hypothetical protein
MSATEPVPADDTSATMSSELEQHVAETINALLAYYQPRPLWRRRLRALIERLARRI